MKSFELAPLDGKEKFVFNLAQPGHWDREAQTYVISSALRSMLRNKNNKAQLRIAASASLRTRNQAGRRGSSGR
ncbi:MAG: hypothetical protein J7L91_05665 [Candidatus Korarchaeota archaeon]|nr:hypothetical protein [Candidatus Korarchaeota archaeon]